MKKTPFYEIHLSLNAKMVQFGGYMMPLRYGSIIDEHNLVRNNVGIFDVSHMGEVKIQGNNALKFLQYITLNDVGKLKEGKAQYNAMIYPDGGLVDDFLVYHCGDHYMLVLNASNIQKDIEWLMQNRLNGVDIIDVSEETSMLAIQGPKSSELINSICGTDLSRLKFYHFRNDIISGEKVLVSRTGYTGEPGYEIYIKSDQGKCESLWNSVIDTGKQYGIGPAGLGARDSLRLEMGYLLYGNDIDEKTNPIEAGLQWITKFDKEDFIGREKLLKIKEKGIEKKLTGLVVANSGLGKRAIPRPGYNIKKNGELVGKVTSGTFSPVLNAGIAMGYLSIEYCNEGQKIEVEIRGEDIPFIITKPPFISRQ